MPELGNQAPAHTANQLPRKTQAEIRKHRRKKLPSKLPLQSHKALGKPLNTEFVGDTHGQQSSCCIVGKECFRYQRSSVGDLQEMYVCVFTLFMAAQGNSQWAERLSLDVRFEAGALQSVVEAHGRFVGRVGGTRDDGKGLSDDEQNLRN